MGSQSLSNKHFKLKRETSIVHRRHLVLYEKYRLDASSAWITDSAEVIGLNLDNPFKTVVSINDKMRIPFQIGVHRAVGGNHDFPNPGDLLCASLASCFESTIRLIADKLGIELIETKIYACAHVDVRGTLMMDKSVPVEFQSMKIEALLIAQNTNIKLMNALIFGAKQSCIVYQTINKGTPITVNADFKIKN